MIQLADGTAVPVITDREDVRTRLRAGAQMVQSALDDGRVVYGVTTGYGASATFGVDPEAAHAMPLNLVRYHGCGTGAPLTERQSAAVIAVRAASLARGYSGVRLELVDRLCQLLQQRILPRIPSEGSVGASGDLTPLSYVAAVLAGEREVHRGDGFVPASVALEGGGPRTPVISRQGGARSSQWHERDDSSRLSRLGAREAPRRARLRADGVDLGGVGGRAGAFRRSTLRAQAPR